MKLVACQNCKDLIMLITKEIRCCKCGETAGKYLDDYNTAVVTKNAIVVGIDNNGFNVAKHLATGEDAQNCKYRVDYFFTGWVPNFPGEVIKVKTVDDVLNYNYHVKEDINYESTSPAKVSEENEDKNKWSWNIFKRGD